MLKVADAVREVILGDDVALQAMQAQLLNFSAYAEQILPRIEDLTFKEVKKGTIVAALARLAPEVSSVHLRPEVVLDDLSIKSPLCDVTFSKTPQTRQKLIELYQKIKIDENSFFMVTQGMSEVTIIAHQTLLSEILTHFETEPKAVYSNKVGISVRFSADYLEVPNMLYTIQAALAVHHINFIEVISTYTEFSLILEKEYLDVATQALKQFFK